MAYDNVKEVDCLDVSKEGTDAWEAACKRSFGFKFILTEFTVLALMMAVGKMEKLPKWAFS